MSVRNEHPFPLLRATPEQIAELRAFVKRPYPAVGRVIGPGFDHTFPPQKAPRPMTILPTTAGPFSPAILDTIGNLLQLAAQIGNPDRARSLWASLIAGVSAEHALNAAAEGLSLQLDVEILKMQYATLQLQITCYQATRTIDDNLREMGWNQAQIDAFHLATAKVQEAAALAAAEDDQPGGEDA